MNLPTLKANAALAKTSQAELELWQMEISPDDVLRLVEVARAALRLKPEIEYLIGPSSKALLATLFGIEP